MLGSYDFMKNLWKPIIFLNLNMLFLLVMFGSLVIYTSLFEAMPWHDPGGMQFLVIFIISDPALLIIGLVFMLINKYYPISKIHRWLPFIAAAGLTLPILIGLSKITLLMGTLIAGLLSMLVIYTTLTNSIRNEFGK